MEGKGVRRCNWVRFCKSSDKLELSNIFASCSEGKITYQTLRAIKPNDEIVVFFNSSSVHSEGNIKQETVRDSEHSVVANDDDDDEEEEEEEEIDVVDFSPEDDKETVTTDKEQDHLDQTKSEFNSSSESGKFFIGSWIPIVKILTLELSGSFFEILVTKYSFLFTARSEKLFFTSPTITSSLLTSPIARADDCPSNVSGSDDQISVSYL